MAKSRKTRRFITLESKITVAQDKVVRAKNRYEKGKRPARYMSQAFSEKIRDFLKNYLDSGFQNGGSRESI